MRPTVRRSLPCAAAAVLDGALALLGPAPAALAHANLTQADPQPGALDALPAQPTLTFDAALGPGSTAQVLDAGGAAARRACWSPSRR
jgi:methionine-rich copper-binding protein CopC